MSFFGLYDTLNCAAMAVNEAESGRPGMAEAAWQKAVAASCSAFPEGSEGDEALGVIIGAAEPARTGEPDRALLWNALNAASLAALAAIGGHRELCDVIWPDAFAAAAALSGDRRSALTVILAEIQRMAEAGDGVAA